MQVLKFGGSILQSEEDFNALRSIVIAASTAKTLVVVSALGSATRDLSRSCMLAVQSNLDPALQHIEQIITDTHDLAAKLLHSDKSVESFSVVLERVREQLHQLMRGISITKQLTDRIQDRVLAFGEDLALHLIEAFLREAGVSMASVDARDVLTTDAQHGAATPLRRETHHNVVTRVLPLFDSHTIVLMQGFVARSTEGHTTTMGRESSNLTAAFMAQMLHAERLYVYTNVAGVRTADPALVSSSRLIPTLSYAQAYHSAVNGMKLLYPTMIEPLRAASIPMVICHLRHPQAESTVVSSVPAHDALRYITVTDGLSLISIVANSSQAARTLHTSMREKISRVGQPFLVNSSPDSYTLVVDSKLRKEFAQSVSDDCRLTVHEGYSCILVMHPGDVIRSVLSNDAVVQQLREVPLSAHWGQHDSMSYVLAHSSDASLLVSAIHALLYS